MHCKSQATVNRIQTIFEELVVQTILPALPEEIEMSVLIEYRAETDKVTMRIRYNGEIFDPTCEQSNELSILLVRNAVETMQYICHSDETIKNEITLISK